jgi:hypothetical protein
VLPFFSTDKCASYSLLIQAVSTHNADTHTTGAVEAVSNNNEINLATSTEQEFFTGTNHSKF